MKTIGVLLVALLFVVPAEAVVVTCVNEGGNMVRIDYSAADEQVLPVAFALDVTVDGGAMITSVYDYKIGDSTAASRGFGIFPVLDAGRCERPGRQLGQAGHESVGRLPACSRAWGRPA